jgi:hypothetical protein
MNPVPPLMPVRKARLKLPADTAAGCRVRAAADLLASTSIATRNGQRLLEASAASWAARAELLQHGEDDFEARRKLRF